MVPIVGGAPRMDATATLIEVPKIEPVSILPPAIDDISEQPYEMSVFFKNQSGDVYRLTAETFLRENHVSVTGYRRSIDWTMNGTILQRDLEDAPACNVQRFHPGMPIFD